MCSWINLVHEFVIFSFFSILVSYKYKCLSYWNVDIGNRNRFPNNCTRFDRRWLPLAAPYLDSNRLSLQEHHLL